MVWTRFFVASCLCLLACCPAQAQRRLPRVYGATGRPYGPTQALYQYQRQYGRPWYGSNRSGLAVANGVPANSYVRSLGYGTPFARRYFGGYPVGGFYRVGRIAGGYVVPQVYSVGPGYGYSTIPMAPLAIQAHPQWIGEDPFDNPVIRETLEENALRWGDGPPAIDDAPDPVERLVEPSSAEAKLRSVHFQGLGDTWFRKQNYLQAYVRYKKAVNLADDRAQAHFRLGWALTALKKYDSALIQFKRGLKIDPDWPATGASLSELFGPAEGELAKISMLHKVGEWVREDVRDPDRLFLLGLMLHFDHDPRAGEVFTTALRLAGEGSHLLAFLEPLDAAIPPDPADGLPAPADPQPPLPPPPEPVAPPPALP